MSKLIPYGKHCLEQDDIDAVVRVLSSDLITQGPKVGEFEQALAAYCGSAHAVVFSSGTAALHGAYFAAGLGPGDEIVTSPITFVATSNAALYLGARPAFVDVEPETGNMDTSAIASAITPQTRILAPVHYSGHPVDMDAVYALARKHGLLVVEDAAHAIGAEYRGRRIGPVADMSILSFHPVKHITCGEGGAVLTDNAAYCERLKTFRIHGIKHKDFVYPSPGPWYYEMQDLGMNYRMTDFQAALGLSQLKKLDRFIARRREVAAAYAEAFAGNPWFDLPVERDYARSSWHLYPIRLKDPYASQKPAIIQFLRERFVGTQVHYIPVHTQPYYRAHGYAGVSLPWAEEFYARELSLPIFQSMTADEQQTVIAAIRDCFARLSARA